MRNISKKQDFLSVIYLLRFILSPLFDQNGSPPLTGPLILHALIVRARLCSFRKMHFFIERQNGVRGVDSAQSFSLAAECVGVAV